MSIGPMEIIIATVIIIFIIFILNIMKFKEVDESVQVNKNNDAETVNSRDIEMGKWIVIEMIISVVLISCCIYAIYEIFNLPMWGENFAGSPAFFFLIGWIIINIWRLVQLYNLKKLF